MQIITTGHKRQRRVYIVVLEGLFKEMLEEECAIKISYVYKRIYHKRCGKPLLLECKRLSFVIHFVEAVKQFC